MVSLVSVVVLVVVVLVVEAVAKHELVVWIAAWPSGMVLNVLSLEHRIWVRYLHSQEHTSTAVTVHQDDATMFHNDKDCIWISW